MEVGVVAGKCPEGLYYALSLAKATESGDAPMSKSGRRLVERVHMITPESKPLRLGAPTLSSAVRVGDTFLKREKTFESLSSCKLIVVWDLNTENFEQGLVQLNKVLGKENIVLVFMNLGLDRVQEVQVAFDARTENKSALVLFGVSTFSCNVLGDTVVQTSLGSILLERIPREGLDGKLHLLAFEGSSVSVVYRSAKYRENWVYASLCWHLIDAYVAVVHAYNQTLVPGSLYEQLWKSEKTRLLYSKLLEEAMTVVSRDEMFRVDGTGSPLGVGPYLARLLLRFPSPLFYVVVHVLCLCSWEGWVSSLKGSNHGSEFSKRRAVEVNGFITAQANARGVEVPANQLVLSIATGECGVSGEITQEQLDACGCQRPLNGIIVLMALLVALYLFLYLIPTFFIGMFVFLVQ